MEVTDSRWAVKPAGAKIISMEPGEFVVPNYQRFLTVFCFVVYIEFSLVTEFYIKVA